jgi:cob(I)alamin adenosyltransferase
LAPFYTGQGDSGDTGYLGEGRISKSSIRIEAVGTVDEATAALGLARALSQNETVKTILLTLQKQLYWLMSELSASPENAALFDKIGQEQISWLEEQINKLEKIVEMPGEFIIPGESPASAALSLARTILRRAERRVVALLEDGGILKPDLEIYLNRTSSLVFLLEIYESSLSGGRVRLVKEE